MSLLLPYYLFLVVGAILLAAFRNSPLVSQTRGLYVSNLLVPPFLLILQELNLEFLWILVLVPIILVSLQRLLRTGEPPRPTPGTFRLCLVIWLIEGALPLLLHFGLRSHPQLERVSLVFAGVILVVGTLVMFLVVAPDLPKHGGDS